MGRIGEEESEVMTIATSCHDIGVAYMEKHLNLELKVDHVLLAPSQHGEDTRAHDGHMPAITSIECPLS